VGGETAEPPHRSWVVGGSERGWRQGRSYVEAKLGSDPIGWLISSVNKQ
jgi:hypothetical protein